MIIEYRNIEGEFRSNSLLTLTVKGLVEFDTNGVKSFWKNCMAFLTDQVS